MSMAVRLFAAAVLVAGIHGGIRLVVQMGVPTGEVRVPKRDLHELPTHLGSWVTVASRDTSELFAETDAEITVVRTLQNAAGEVVSLYAAVWLDHSRIRHPPELCLEGFGHEILQEKTIQLDVADQKTIPVRFFVAQRDGQRTNVLYWYRRGDSILLLRTFQRRATWTPGEDGSWPPLIKVMLQTAGSDAEKAERQLKSIAVPTDAWTKEL